MGMKSDSISSPVYLYPRIERGIDLQERPEGSSRAKLKTH